MRFLLALLPLLLLGASASAPPSESSDPIRPLAGLVGTWQGELSYRDYRSDAWVALPAKMTGRLSGDGQHLVTDLALRDPGRTVHTLTVTRFDPATGRMESIDFAGGGDERQVLVASEQDVESEDRWTLVFLDEGSDDGAQAEFRLTRSLADGRLISRQEVRRSGEEEWMVRNELVVERASAARSIEDLAGRWRVDLRPTPESEASYAWMELEVDEEGSLTGSFYGSPIRDGRLNDAWEELHFSFVTDDGTGAYHTSGRLLADGSVAGTTHSLGRGFLSVWTGGRVDED